MSLIDEARQEARTQGPKCGVGKLLITHPDIVEELDAALDDPLITAAAISRALSKRYGDVPSGLSIARHRNHECKCR